MVFCLNSIGDNLFDLRQEHLWNYPFLDTLLRHLQVHYSLEKKILKLISPVPSYQEWKNCLNLYTGKGDEGSPVETLRIQTLDAPIIGVVSQLNRLGVKTTQSCGGHIRNGQRRSLPYLKLACPTDLLIVKTLSDISAWLTASAMVFPCP